MLVTSRTNTRIKQLRRLAQRKYRLQAGQFVVEGQKLIAEAQAAGCLLQELYLPAELDWPTGQPEIVHLSADLLAYASQLESPPDAIGVFQLRALQPDLQRAEAWLLTENLQDPGNFGALLRLADAMGWRGVLALGAYPDPFQHKVIRASMVSCLRLPVVPVELDSLQQWRQQGWRIVTTAAQAPEHSLNCALPKRLLLALGHEGQGLSPELLGMSDLQVAIPMWPAVDSLNVVTAAAMLVHEYMRQRQTDGP